MFFKTYIIALIVFFIIDILWIGFIAKDLYAKYIGHMLKEKVNWPAAIIFYLLFIVGLVVFVISPALTAGMWTSALGYGALFGLITYATYDLTNLATTKNWPLGITIIDLIWGSVLAASVSTATFFLVNLL